MAITGDGGVLVTPPVCVPARFGLLSAAEIDDRPDGHWQAGIEYELETCDDLFVMSPKCNAPDTRDDVIKDVDGGTVSSDNYADPFTMVAAYKCATGGRPIEEAWEHAQRRLNRGENRALERAFWTGLDVQGNDIRQSLGTNPDVVDLTGSGGALSITDGLAVLEAWAGDEYPCLPMIHANRGLGVYMAERGIVVREESSLISAGTGSRVVIGGGYNTTGPLSDVPDAGKSWMYVTGSIKVIRSPMFFTPERGDNGGAIDRTVNDIVVFAERTYAIEQDCIVGAVLVTYGSCC